MPTIYDILNDLEIPYTEYRHPAVFTSAEAELLARNVPGDIAKNLFLTNKEESRFYLVSGPPQKRVDLKWLRALLKETKLHFLEERAQPLEIDPLLRGARDEIKPAFLLVGQKEILRDVARHVPGE